MANFALVIILLFSTFASAQSVFDMGEHSGIIRDSTGNYSQVSANGSVRSLTSNTALALIEKPIIQTSKGAVEVALSRSVSVDVSRLGSAVSKFAQRVGPLAMAISTAQLICDLSEICNVNGQWKTIGSAPNGDPGSYPSTDGSWYGWDDRYYASPESGCSDSRRLELNIGVGATYHSIEYVNDSVYKCYGSLPQFPGSVYYASNTSKLASCATGYALSGSNCVRETAATAADWSSKESALNNSGFVPELFNSGESIPVGLPALDGSPVNVPLGTTTKTLKDGSGTVTGTETAADSLNITDGATSTTPNVINITQTTINTTYNNSNVVTGSTTTTSDPVQPVPPNKADPLEIKFDTVNDTPLTEKVVTAPFTTISWGSGECPPDIAMNLTRGNFSIDSQPFCNFAISLKPVLLLVAALAGAYIVITSSRPTTS